MVSEVLNDLAGGKISVAQAEKRLKLLAITELQGTARIDTGREFRKGIPEIVIAEGKTVEDLRQIVSAVLKENGQVIVSRLSPPQYNSIRSTLRRAGTAYYRARAKILVVKKKGSLKRTRGGSVGILTAGTSDIPVAEEAKVIAEEMGCKVFSAYDVGVAGLHRLFNPLRKMIDQEIDVLIVVAGREGALPTVVAGLMDIPVIAVPTSMGYGFGDRGHSALAAMLQACSLGLAVVNIDAGVAAGALAALIARRAARGRKGL